MASPNGKAEQRKATWLLVLMLLPALAFGAFVLWTLHHPNPTVRAPVPIDRNSLLPHLYPGACINCHRIEERGPVAIDAGNMNRHALTPLDRRLILAGQRVEVLPISQRVGVPAITRTDGLPHSYIGVCSNCHVVLDVHPSPEFMQQAMRRASKPLITLSPAEVAHGGSTLDDARSRRRRLWGYAALPLLLLTVAFVVVRALARARPGLQRRASRTLVLHEISAAAFCTAALVHWYYSDRGNNFLHLSLVTLSWLVAGGLLMGYRAKLVRRDVNAAFRRAQWLAFGVFVVLLLLGHFFGEFT